ncbi:MAG: glycosyltransferase family 2 protein, partial [Promethearchaeota archaeon]
MSRNPFFFKDKYNLVKVCLNSFKSCLGSIKTKIWVLLDNCPPKYTLLFKKVFDEKNLKIIELNGIGNRRTFELQFDILVNQEDAELVYFAEDDYFYLPYNFKEMLNLIKKNKDIDIISPYDHPDYYIYDIHDYKKSIKVLGDRKWVNNIST